MFVLMNIHEFVVLTCKEEKEGKGCCANDACMD